MTLLSTTWNGYATGQVRLPDILKAGAEVPEGPLGQRLGNGEGVAIAQS
jgi:hypothetical protein